MPTYTPNYDLPKPNVNSADDEDQWGDQLNEGMDIIDTQLKRVEDFASGGTDVVTANYALTADDRNQTKIIDATAGNVVITGDAALGNGFEVTLLRIDATANTVTFDPTGGQTVNGVATVTIPNQYGSLTLISDATNWYISNDRTGIASAAETLAGVSAALALSPAGFAGNKDIQAEGYYKLPGGLIIQWGTSTFPPEAPAVTTTVTYPIPFPNNVFSVAFSTGIPSLADAHNFAQIIGDPGLANFVGANQYVSGANAAIKTRWIAIGN